MRCPHCGMICPRISRQHLKSKHPEEYAKFMENRDSNHFVDSLPLKPSNRESSSYILAKRRSRTENK